MKTLAEFIRTNKERELSAKDFEGYTDQVLLLAYRRQYTHKLKGLNKAKLGLELINRGIHPFIKS